MGIHIGRVPSIGERFVQQGYSSYLSRKWRLGVGQTNRVRTTAATTDGDECPLLFSPLPSTTKMIGRALVLDQIPYLQDRR